MDGALRGSIRKSLGVAVLAVAFAAGFVVHGIDGSRSARPAASHAPKTFSASDLLRAAATATPSKGIYLQFDGITGPSGLAFGNYPQMTSFSFGVSRSASNSTANRNIGTPNISDINLTHSTDKFTAPFLQASLTGNGTGKAVVYFTDVNVGGKLAKYLEFDLTNVAVTSMNMSSGGDRPSESLSLNFTALTMVAHIDGSPTQTVSYTIP